MVDIPSEGSRFCLGNSIPGCGGGVGVTGTCAGPWEMDVRTMEVNRGSIKKPTATLQESGTVYGSDSEGQESDELELHDRWEDEVGGEGKRISPGFYTISLAGPY